MGFWKAVKNNALSYSQSTPVLGIAFIGEPGRPYTERSVPKPNDGELWEHIYLFLTGQNNAYIVDSRGVDS